MDNVTLPDPLLEPQTGPENTNNNPIKPTKDDPDNYRHTCLKCGAWWIRRTLARPAQCPRCKSRLWDGPVRPVPSRHCLRCDFSWTPRVAWRPAQCPRCKCLKWDKPAPGRKTEEQKDADTLAFALKHAGSDPGALAQVEKMRAALAERWRNGAGLIPTEPISGLPAE